MFSALKNKRRTMTLSVAQLENALAIRTKIDKLESIITRLHKQLQGILGGETVKIVKSKAVRRKYRKIKAQQKIKPVKNEGGTLKEALIKVLSQAGKPLHINDILKGVKDAGYKSGAKDIKKIIGVRLYAIKEFIKTAPGTFTLKAKGKKIK
jgi:hypothetical protein